MPTNSHFISRQEQPIQEENIEDQDQRGVLEAAQDLMRLKYGSPDPY